MNDFTLHDLVQWLSFVLPEHTDIILVTSNDYFFKSRFDKILHHCAYLHYVVKSFSYVNQNGAQFLRVRLHGSTLI